MNVGVRTAPGLNGTVVILAAWCPHCRDEVMPDGNGDCNWCKTPIVDEHTLNAKDAIASTNTNGGHLMAVTATSVAWCKREGCDEEAEDTAGPYAKLCPAHKREARDARAAAPKLRASRSTVTGGASLADAARKLVPLARALDKTRAQLAALPEQTSAKAAFDEATRRASAQPSTENLTRVGETLKQLQTTAPKRTKLENDVSSAERALGLALQSFAREARAA